MSQAPGAQPNLSSVYHERQRLELCAVHALNNVLQQQLFSQEAADEICKRLAPDSRLNPHRSLLGTGNYDVNVIMAALQGLGLATVWWDRRRPLSQLALPQVLGLILNLPSPMSLGLLSLPVRRRHWVALRQGFPGGRAGSGPVRGAAGGDQGGRGKGLLAADRLSLRRREPGHPSIRAVPAHPRLAPERRGRTRPRTSWTPRRSQPLLRTARSSRPLLPQ
uniref:Josephin-2 n=1 Tax=Callorhinus ursinus TaxID=34884 RepID=A0A3Q7MG08_CALUR|nr:josephin-2 isoform X1 [Callorhinus ursinus]XP_025705776.1 josephin-2 isoform X1 [Callorhinus ursinus]XP_025705777.1 josephin-2 isoform X1 [Callorhinus ursinus]